MMLFVQANSVSETRVVVAFGERHDFA